MDIKSNLPLVLTPTFNSPTVCPPDEESPVLKACRLGHVSWLRDFLADNDHRLANRAFLTGNNGILLSPLFIAAENGQDAVVGLLLNLTKTWPEEQRNDLVLQMLNTTSQGGTTPLVIATRNGHTEVVRLLTEALSGAVNTLKAKQASQAITTTLNATDTDDTTPLYVAVKRGHDGIVRCITSTLMQTPATHSPEHRLQAIMTVLNASCRYGVTTPLLIAAHNGCSEIIELLTFIESVAQEAGKATTKIPSLITKALNTTGTPGFTPLFLAATKGRTTFVAKLLELAKTLPAEKYKRTTMNMLKARCNIDKVTALTGASGFGHDSVVALLTEAQMQCTATLPEKDRARAFMKVLDEMVTHGALPLYIATQNRHLRVVQRLVNTFKQTWASQSEEERTQAAITTLTKGCFKGLTPLYAAAYFGFHEFVEPLLELAEGLQEENYARTILAALNVRGVNGRTPLHCAVREGHLKVVQQFIGVLRKALPTSSQKERDRAIVSQLNTPCRYGSTALFATALHGRTEILEWLQGLIRTLNDEEQISTIQTITSTGHMDGATMLYIAAQNGHASIVKQIIEITKELPSEQIPQTILSALTTPSDSGVTPLLIAAQNGHVDVVRHLLAALNAAVKTLPAKSQHTTFTNILNHAWRIGGTPLFIAASEGHARVVEQLLISLSAAAKALPEREQNQAITAVLNTTTKTSRTPLYVAAKNGHLQVVKKLTAFLDTTIQALPEEERSQSLMPILNFRSNYGTTPLHIALLNGHHAIAGHLCSALKILPENNRYDAITEMILTPDTDGDTPLYFAAEEGCIAVVREFTTALQATMATKTLAENLQTVRSLLLVTRDCEASPLSIAIKKGHLNVVEQLLGIVQTLPTEKQSQVIQSVLGSGNKLIPPPFCAAAKYGQLNIVKGLTHALQEALATEPEEKRTQAIIQMLETTGAKNATPLYNAAKNGHDLIVKWLLEHGVNPRKGRLFHPLGKYPALKGLLSQTPCKAAIKQQHDGISDRLRASIRKRKTDIQPPSLERIGKE